MECAEYDLFVMEESFIDKKVANDSRIALIHLFIDEKRILRNINEQINKIDTEFINKSYMWRVKSARIWTIANDISSKTSTGSCRRHFLWLDVFSICIIPHVLFAISCKH